MIYMLEDDNSIRNYVLYALNQSAGMKAMGFEKPSDFWKAMKEELPEVILLDIMLPEEDGLSVLKKLRKNVETKEIPVIMLTAKDTVYDKILGLDSGADDYLAKPFETMELIARIKVWQRRGKKEKANSEYTYKGLFVSVEKHIVKANGEDVILTLKEFELLSLLIRNQGTVFNRDTILRTIWGYEFDGENRTVDVHIRKLREKLGDCGEVIETVRGIGYKIGESL